jgi:hypothetical protein
MKLNKVLNVTKEMGKAMVTKQNAITAAKILGGVAIGIGTTMVEKKSNMFGGKTVVKHNKKIAVKNCDNKKIAVVGTGIGLGVTAVIAAKNAIPHIKSVMKVAGEVAEEVIE